MSKSKKSILVILAVGAVLLFTGWALIGHWQGKSSPVKIVFIPKIVDDSDFWGSLTEGAQVAAKEYDADMTITGADSENDYIRQRELLLQAAEDRPDVIMIAPSSFTDITDAIKQTLEMGIKVVLVDSSIDQELGLTLVATDNFQAGQKMGDFIKNNLPDSEPVIGIVAHVKGSSTAMEREYGLRDGLGEYEKNIVDTVFCNSNYQKAYEVTKEMLEKNPGINVIAGLNEYSAVGAARAVKDLGLAGNITMVGFDSSIEEIQLLEEGVFKGIIIQKPFNMGYLGVQKAVEIAHGTVVEKNVDSGSELITKDNMYTEENQKLLFHFRESN